MDHQGSVWRQLGPPGTILKAFCVEVICLYTFLWKVTLTFPSFSLGSLLVYIGLFWFVLGPKDPMGGDPWEPKGPHGRGTLGSPRDPMGGEPSGPHWELI